MEKGPRIRGWQRDAARQHDDAVLWEHIDEGGNYGVVTGYGNLVVLDIDDVRLDKYVGLTLPETFTVTTGSGGHHYYFILSEPCPPMRLRMPDKPAGSAGDLKSIGGQVVGPGSIHPSGKLYWVSNPIDIAQTTCSVLRETLSPFLIKRPVTPERGQSSSETPDIMKVLPPSKIVCASSQVKGEHPIHGSSTGGNYSVNTRENVWFCFRCGSGGSGWHALAMREGLLECHECGPGSIDRDMFCKLLDIAKKEGLITDD